VAAAADQPLAGHGHARSRAIGRCESIRLLPSSPGQ
jgi:hypothetical protein